AREVAGLPQGVIGELAWSPDAESLVFTLTAPTRPRELWLLDVASGAARCLHGAVAIGLERHRLVDWRLVEFPSFDGRSLPSWLAVPEAPPPAAGRKAVVWV